MKTWEDLLFVSDCHLSDGSKTGDDFLSRKEKFIMLLDWMDANGINRIATVGDFVDCWEADAKKIRGKYKDIFDRMLAKRWFYINGNHDQMEWVLQAFISELSKPTKMNVSFHQELIINSRKLRNYPIGKAFPLIAKHGHQYDQIISKYPKLSGVVARVGGFMERHGFPNVDKWFGKFEKWISGVGKHDQNSGMDKLFSEDAMKNNFKSAIAGHTHKEKSVNILDDEGKTRLYYFNTGSWVNSDRPCRAVILKEEVFRVVEATQNGMKIINEQDFNL